MNGSFRVAAVTIARLLPSASRFAAALSSADPAKLINKVEAYALMGARSAPVGYRAISSSLGIADLG